MAEASVRDGGITHISKMNHGAETFVKDRNAGWQIHRTPTEYSISKIVIN